MTESFTFILYRHLNKKGFADICYRRHLKVYFPLCPIRLCSSGQFLSWFLNGNFSFSVCRCFISWLLVMEYDGSQPRFLRSTLISVTLFVTRTWDAFKVELWCKNPVGMLLLGHFFKCSDRTKRIKAFRLHFLLAGSINNAGQRTHRC